MPMPWTTRRAAKPPKRTATVTSGNRCCRHVTESSLRQSERRPTGTALPVEAAGALTRAPPRALRQAPPVREGTRLGLAHVGEDELLEADRLRLPASWQDSSRVAVQAREEMSLASGEVRAHDRQPADQGRRFSRRTGEHAVTAKQVVDLARDLDLPRREDDEVVADALQLGDHVR